MSVGIVVEIALPDLCGADMSVVIYGSGNPELRRTISQAFQEGLHLANFRIPSGGVTWILQIEETTEDEDTTLEVVTKMGYYMGKQNFV